MNPTQKEASKPLLLPSLIEKFFGYSPSTPHFNLKSLILNNSFIFLKNFCQFFYKCDTYVYIEYFTLY